MKSSCRYVLYCPEQGKYLHWRWTPWLSKSVPTDSCSSSKEGDGLYERGVRNIDGAIENVERVIRNADSPVTADVYQKKLDNLLELKKARIVVRKIVTTVTYEDIE